VDLKTRSGGPRKQTSCAKPDRGSDIRKLNGFCRCQPADGGRVVHLLIDADLIERPTPPKRPAQDARRAPRRRDSSCDQPPPFRVLPTIRFALPGGRCDWLTLTSDGHGTGLGQIRGGHSGRSRSARGALWWVVGGALSLSLIAAGWRCMAMVALLRTMPSGSRARSKLPRPPPAAAGPKKKLFLLVHAC